MAWKVAASLLHLRQQVNAKYPDRRKDSDGTIGDERHQSRDSDHNAWVKEGSLGVVTAMDITHDPDHGCDSYAIAEKLRLSQDSRIKYVISNHRICASYNVHGEKAWTWRSYHGANPHTKHVHISVLPDKVHYDNVKDWAI